MINAPKEELMFKLVSVSAPLTLSMALFSTLLCADAGAQPYPARRVERNASAVEAQRSGAKVADDRRDLQRFQMTLQAFDAAMARRDQVGVRNALRSFVQQGRAEVAEQRRETIQAQNEAARSAAEVRRDVRNPGPGGRHELRDDRRDARDDRRDARQERAELAREEALLAQLERAAAAEFRWGPQVPVLRDARQAMVQFVELARIELQRSRQELREDRRELREDQRNLRRGPGY